MLWYYSRIIAAAYFDIYIHENMMASFFLVTKKQLIIKHNNIMIISRWWGVVFEGDIHFVHIAFSECVDDHQD